jgi:DNA-binding Lrp family transcriptional regulator
MNFTFNNNDYMEQEIIDTTDKLILTELQRDASQSNVALAQRVHTSAPTCLRRVKRLHDLGLIERQIAVLQPDKVAAHLGHGLTGIVEVTLDRQNAEELSRFEARVLPDAAVQQCYRVSPGPDFVLVVYCKDMPAYQALAQRLFTSDANVRNVKVFFSIQRSKFGAQIQMDGA